MTPEFAEPKIAMTQPTDTHATSGFLATAGGYGFAAACVSAILGLPSLFFGLCMFGICSSIFGAAIWIAEEIKEVTAARKRGSGPAATSDNKTKPSDDRKPTALANVSSPMPGFTGAANSAKPAAPATNLIPLPQPKDPKPCG